MWFIYLLLAIAYLYIVIDSKGANFVVYSLIAVIFIVKFITHL